MDTEAKVLRVSARSVEVEVRREGACGGHCATCSGCAAQVMHVTAVADVPVRPGDRVRLSGDRGALFAALFTVYILPLFLPVAAWFLAAPRGFGVPAVLIGIAVSCLLIWLLSRSKRFLHRSAPHIISVISREEVNS